MKEDKFNNIVREKIYRHEMPVPDDLWNKLESELQVVPSKKTPLFKRYMSIAAIAASILLTGGAIIYLTQQIDSVDTPVANTLNPSENTVVTPVNQITEKLTAVSKKTASVQLAKPAHSRLIASAPSEISNGYDSTDRIEDQTIDTPSALNISGQKNGKIAHPVSDQDKDAKTKAFIQDGKKAQTGTISNTRVKKKEKENVQLAVNFGNTGFANSLQKQPYATLRTKIDKNMVQFAQDMHPHSMGSSTNVTHHTPISFGIMVSKKLPYNLAVESGIRYTYLHSNLENPEKTRKESQQLHYLGIPLSLKYNFWRWKNLNAYAKLGGAIDFNIAGTWKEIYNYQADFGTGHASAFSEDLEKRPQLSVSGSLGIAYSLSNLFQFYFEPGVSYYFNNLTGVRNIRKEKPLDLSFQLGGRFSF